MIDISGQQHEQTKIPKHVTCTGHDTVEFVGKYIDGLVSANKLDRRLILGAVMTIPGSINLQSGFLTKSVLLNWPEFAIEERLSERLGCHVRVENNGDALCRHFMDTHQVVDEQHSCVFLAHVSEGMGASIAMGGRIVRRLADEGWINDIKISASPSNGDNAQRLGDLTSGRAILRCALKANEAVKRNGVEFGPMIQEAVALANQDAGSIASTFYDRGCILGANLVPLTTAIAPEVIVLAGPVLGAQVYSQGVRAGYEKAVAEMNLQPSKIIVSDASYSDAAENLALHDFFLSGAYHG
ncbi:MAG: ROK family protein [Litoreibacter sp.]|uniref:ROK family protein n=1 Tax=Litoreibacter sp. TaxID=1969459 RepID=UPI003296C142